MAPEATAAYRTLAVALFLLAAGVADVAASAGDIADRVQQLLSSMTLQEKVGQLQNNMPAIPRLGIKGYDFWQECLHGMLEQRRPEGKKAPPTVFPQPILLAATFDTALVQRVFTSISDELRAKDNAERNRTGGSRALVCWTPHINLFRDPRWGRGSETYGEDPHLTSRMAVSIVRGLQGSSPSGVIKAAATCKHFVAYSLEGAEGWSRFSFDARITPQDMADTYLPAFQACVQEAGAVGVMCSYNRVNGVPSCVNKRLLQDQLRGAYNFSGYVVTDCGALKATTSWGHGYTKSLPDALASSLDAGVHLMCDNAQPSIVMGAVKEGVVTEAMLDAALTATFTTRFRVGEFDPPPPEWAGLDLTVVNSPPHRALAREAAAKGMVLLKNIPVAAPAPSTGCQLPDGCAAGSPPPALLPLTAARLPNKKVCVVGPLANATEHLLGNYYGFFDAAKTVSPLRGIVEALAGMGVSVAYAKGSNLLGVAGGDTGGGTLEDALQACLGADVALLFLGTSTINPYGWPKWDLPFGELDPILPSTEGEGLDKMDLRLPGRQADIVDALTKRAPGLPLVVTLLTGGALDVSTFDANPSVAAMVWAAAPGQEGGHAIADILFGAIAPSGRLPMSWYHGNFTAAAPMSDMRMRPDPATGYPGRSYRFTTAPLLYPFGYGLSTTRFEYTGLHVASPLTGGCDPQVAVHVNITNTGALAAEHVVLCMLAPVGLQVDGQAPRRSLRSFQRTRLLVPGEQQEVVMQLTARDFQLADDNGNMKVLIGRWRVEVGSLTTEVVTSAVGAQYCISSPLSSSPGSLLELSRDRLRRFFSRA